MISYYLQNMRICGPCSLPRSLIKYIKENSDSVFKQIFGRIFSQVETPTHHTESEMVWRQTYATNDASSTTPSVSVPNEILPPFVKTCNYRLRVRKSSSRLIRFTVNNIYIYGSKSIYYKNIFHN
jgi:hypothetical protein